MGEIGRGQGYAWVGREKEDGGEMCEDVFYPLDTIYD